jgi:hypothetical protein
MNDQHKVAVETASARHSLAVAAKTTADQERARIARQRGAVIDHLDNLEAKLSLLRAKLGEMAWNGEVIEDLIPEFLARQAQSGVINTALATFGQREIFKSTQRALIADVNAIDSEIVLKSAELEAHRATVQEQINKLSEVAGPISTTSLGGVARAMGERLVELDKALTHAQRLVKEHAEKEAK